MSAPTRSGRMPSVALETLVTYLDTLLATASTPDYPPALNG